MCLVKNSLGRGDRLSGIRAWSAAFELARTFKKFCQLAIINVCFIAFVIVTETNMPL